MTRRWQQNAGLLALRAGTGGVLAAHGVQKLFGWFGGPGLEGTGAAFEQMGFAPGRQSALAAGLGETGGGLLIALGLATPVAGAAAAGTMIPAAAVHAPKGFFATGGGYEYPALLGVSAAALALTGPGDWSLDALLGHRLNREWLTALALLASSAASLAIVRRRRGVLAARTASPGRQAVGDTAAHPTPRSVSTRTQPTAEAEPGGDRQPNRSQPPAPN
ncbi:MAG: DoxX family protein [Streptosporangiaceae bacterium]